MNQLIIFYHEKFRKLLYEKMPSNCPSLVVLLERIQLETLEKKPLENNVSIASLLSSISFSIEGLTLLLNQTETNILPIGINTSSKEAWENTKLYLERLFEHFLESLRLLKEELLFTNINTWNEKIIDRIESVMDKLLFTTGQIHLIRELYEGYNTDDLIDLISRTGKY